MKICLFNPIPVYTYPPLNLTYLSSYLKKYGSYSYEIKLIDVNFCNNPLTEIINFNPSILGFTTLSPFIVEIYEMSKEIKRLNKNIIQIFGGVHASIDPKGTLEMSGADIVVIGEGEVTFKEIVDCCVDNSNNLDTKILSKIDGIAYKNDGCIKMNKSRALITDLDVIPHPERQLLNRNYYKRYFIIRGKNTSGMHMISVSRGCPYQCIFCCANVVGRNKLRYHSPSYIIEEIESLILEYKARWLFFFDDIFFIDKAKVIELCDLMIKRGLNKKVKWEVQIRSNLVKERDLPILKLMKEAGCIQIEYGFESGNQRVLTFIKGKGITVEDHQRAIDLTNKAGMKVLGSFILGTPTETYKELLDTRKFILKNHKSIYRFQVSCMIPYPGTKVYDLSVEKGLLSGNYYEEIKKEKDNKMEHGLKVFCDTIPTPKVLELRKELDNLSFNRISLGQKIKWLIFNFIYSRKTILDGIRWRISRIVSGKK